MTRNVDRRTGGRVSATLVLTLAAGLAMAGAGAPTASGSGAAGKPSGNATEAVVRSESNGVTYAVAAPGASESEAARVFEKGGAVKATLRHPGFTLFNRVMVNAEDRAAVEAAVAAFGGGSRLVGPVGTFEDLWEVRTATVAEALAFADAAAKAPGIARTQVDEKIPLKTTAFPSDPFISTVWHIENTTNPGVDHNLRPVYESGITGAGITIGILEVSNESFDETHPDLNNSFRPGLSQPVNPFSSGSSDFSHATAVAGVAAADGNDGVGLAGVAFDAGLAQLVGGNAFSQSIAFDYEKDRIQIKNNSWGPVPFRTPPDDDTGQEFYRAPEAYDLALGYYTGGPDAAIQGLRRAIELGRGGRGEVMVFAAGNDRLFPGWQRFRFGNATSLPAIDRGTAALPGGLVGILDGASVSPTINAADFQQVADDVTVLDPLAIVLLFQGLVDRNTYSRFGAWLPDNPLAGNKDTIAVAALGENNRLAYYSTMGPGILTSAYSFGIGSDLFPSQGDTDDDLSLARGIRTTDLLGTDGASCGLPTNYTCDFGGTSAAAPVVSGIIALMLQANPSLSIRDIKHIIKLASQPVDFPNSFPINFDPAIPYIFSDGAIANPGAAAFDDGVSFWQVNAAFQAHSDEYGFGVLDAQRAVELASNWTPLGPAVEASTGRVTVEDGEIDDASFAEISETLSVLVPGPSNFFQFCVRPNIVIEDIEIELTISGEGAGDLMIELISPTGTKSMLAVPRPSYGFVTVNGATLAASVYPFHSLKHWGELSGGPWTIRVTDYIPDEATPEGDEIPDDPNEDDGANVITLLGAYGHPGNPLNTEKAVTQYRVSFFGSDSGLPGYFGCNPLGQQCPGDLNGDGRIDFDDFLLFLQWYNSLDPLADLTGDGFVDIFDIRLFVSIFRPGFCANGQSGGPWSRPRPGQRPVIDVGGGNTPE